MKQAKEKEKAEELVNSYKNILMNEDTECGNEILCTLIAMQCALIAIEEIKQVCPYIDANARETLEELNTPIFQFVSFWEEVEQEVKKL